MSEIPGMAEHGVEVKDVSYDKKRDGVWVKNQVFLPRNVVIWAFRALAAAKPEEAPK